MAFEGLFLKTFPAAYRGNVVRGDVAFALGFDVLCVPPIAIRVVNHYHQLVLLEAQVILRASWSGFER